MNEDKLEIIRLLKENAKQKKSEKSQDEENEKKDSETRRKDESFGLKFANKENGTDKVENKKTAKSSVNNEGTSGPTDNSKRPEDGDRNPSKAKSKCKNVLILTENIF